MLVSFVVDIFSPTYGFFAKVDSGYVGIITHFGEIKDDVLPAGFHVTGYFDHVHPINVRTQIKSGDVVAFSSDIQQVTLHVSINYNVTPEAANKLYKTISGDYFATLIAPRVNENVKVIVSNYTAESLIRSREVLSAEVLKLMQHDLEPYGITATAISIENIDFTDAFENAVEAKQVATQEAQKARTQQEQQTMEAQQEAQRKKIAAEAAADVTRTEADAKAYETRVHAEAEAEANQKIAASITDTLIEYVQAQNWDGKLPGTYVGVEDAVPIINTDNSFANAFQ
jgi:regulator of protease activity HflC (stomatin/prohibitin superfamily)